MTNISIYAHGDINVASTRLRAHYLFLPAQKNGYKTYYNESFFSALKRDVLYLQMVYKPKNFLQALIFRMLRKKVIFDIDDAALFIKHKLFMLLMSNIASIITVDTNARKLFWIKRTISKNIKVVRDAIDINPDGLKFSRRKLAKNGGILWIGNRENLHSIVPLFKLNEIYNQREIYVASNFERADPIKLAYKKINFLDWQLNISFNTSEINASFMVLNHLSSSDKYSQYKSENKMVTAIASGLIPIVSASPAYLELASKLDAEKLVFQSLDDVPEILNSLDEVWMHKFSQKAQEFIKTYYSHTKVFADFKRLVLDSS
jgi:hypothetical protein